MFMQTIELPKYLDVLLIINNQATKTKIYKLLDRSKDYLTNALRYLQEKDLITITKGTRDDTRIIQIELTPKGKDAQNIVYTLYALMGLKK